jgi:hypothetical protein
MWAELTSFLCKFTSSWYFIKLIKMDIYNNFIPRTLNFHLKWGVFFLRNLKQKKNQEHFFLWISFGLYQRHCCFSHTAGKYFSCTNSPTTLWARQAVSDTPDELLHIYAILLHQNLFTFFRIHFLSPCKSCSSSNLIERGKPSTKFRGKWYALKKY